jgi:hypothetical protein
LAALKYPLYFIDFETVNPAIPRFKGMRPYRQIPFQWSVVANEISSINPQGTHQERRSMILRFVQPLVKPTRSITISTQGEFMANLNGLASIVSELRVERTNLPNQIRHVNAAL